MTSKRRRSAQAASSATQSDKTEQSTPERRKKGTPGRPARSSRHASQQAKEQHQAEANAIQEGISDLNKIVAALRKLKAGGEPPDEDALPRDWMSEETLVAMTEVIDENPRPSLEYVLGVVGASEVPKRLNERQRSQGARAFTAHLRNRAIRRKREAMEEKQKQEAEKLKAQAQAEAKKAAEKEEKEKKEREKELSKGDAMEVEKTQAVEKEKGKDKDTTGNSGKAQMSTEKAEKQTPRRRRNTRIDGDKEGAEEVISRKHALPEAKVVKEKGPAKTPGNSAATNKNGEKETEKKGQDVEMDKPELEQRTDHASKNLSTMETAEGDQSSSKEQTLMKEGTPAVAMESQNSKEKTDVTTPEAKIQTHVKADTKQIVKPVEKDVQIEKAEPPSAVHVTGRRNNPERRSTRNKTGEKNTKDEMVVVGTEVGKNQDDKKATQFSRANEAREHVTELEKDLKDDQVKEKVVAEKHIPEENMKKKGAKGATSGVGRSNILQASIKSAQPDTETVSNQTENGKDAATKEATPVAVFKKSGKEEPKKSTPRTAGPSKVEEKSKTANIAPEPQPPNDATRNTRSRPKTMSQSTTAPMEVENPMPPKKGRKSVDEGDDGRAGPSTRAQVSSGTSEPKPRKLLGLRSTTDADVVMKDSDAAQATDAGQKGPTPKPRERAGGRRKFSRFADAKTVAPKESEATAVQNTKRPTTAKKVPRSAPATSQSPSNNQAEKHDTSAEGKDDEKKAEERDFINKGKLAHSTEETGKETYHAKQKDIETGNEPSEKNPAAKTSRNVNEAPQESEPSEEDEERKRAEMEKKSPPRKRAALGALKSKVPSQAATPSDESAPAKQDGKKSIVDEKSGSNEDKSGEIRENIVSAKAQRLSSRNSKSTSEGQPEDEEKSKEAKGGEEGRQQKDDHKTAEEKDVAKMDDNYRKTKDAPKSPERPEPIVKPERKERADSSDRVKRPVGRPPKKTETRLPKKRFQDLRHSDDDEITPVKGPKNETAEQEGPDSSQKPSQEDRDESVERTQAKSSAKTRKKDKERVVERRVGSRRFSFLREDPINRHIPQTRLRRESSHLRDPTSLPPDTDPYMVDCYHIWKDIKQDKISIPFRDPVQAKDAPGYFDVIKKPMDLSTVLRQIESKRIKTPDDFYKSMKLICSNAMLFNGRGSDLYELAEELLDKIRKAMKPVLKTWRASIAAAKKEVRDPSPPSPASSASSEEKKESESERESESESENSSEEEEPTARRSNSRGRGRGGAVATRGTGRGRGRKRGRGRPPRGGYASRGGSGSFSDDDGFVEVPPPRGRKRGRGRGARGGASGSGRGRKRGRSEEETPEGRKKRRLPGRKRRDEE